MLAGFFAHSTLFNINVFNLEVLILIFYGNVRASYLSLVIRNHE